MRWEGNAVEEESTFEILGVSPRRYLSLPYESGFSMPSAWIAEQPSKNHQDFTQWPLLN